ncbi:MAG: hypothetical protein IJ003_03345 [Candidatus Gastranaerophilales bacterium]|nr:hypothetical protein [Candidatus Gastranaerophilales bacterium]
MTIIPENLIIHSPDKKLLKKMNDFELDEEVLFECESDFHSISVVDTKIGRFLKYNDTYQAGFIKTKEYKGNLPYINYFLIPYLINDNVKNILFIGLGSGFIIKQYEKLFKNLKKIDIIDIEENIPIIAQRYFDFNFSNISNFYLQDALIFLKNTKIKYDLIVVDVAGDEGIDERFCDKEYLKLIKKRLTKNGIFVSNMPSSRDIFHKNNQFALNLIKDYKENFKNVLIFNGETSNEIFYKTFFDLDEIVLDVTNLIMISADIDLKISEKNITEIVKLKIDINKYLKDLVNN